MEKERRDINGRYCCKEEREGGDDDDDDEGREEMIIDAAIIEKNQAENTRIHNDASLSYEELFRLRHLHFSDCVSLSYKNTNPLWIVKGKGTRLYDHTGQSYLDTRNNVAHVGHCHPTVVNAVQQQVATLNTNSRYLHANICELASRLIQKLRHDITTSVLSSEGHHVNNSNQNRMQLLNKVFFVNSGSEANDLALRLCRASSSSHNGGECSKNTIVIDYAYHGHTISDVEVSPYKYEHSGEFARHVVSNGEEEEEEGRTKGVEYVKKVPCPDMYRGRHASMQNSSAITDEEEKRAATLYAQYVKDACAEFGKGNVSAFIVESGMSVAGVIIPPKGYLYQAVKTVREYGGLYIADEVQVGFGRFGTSFWGYQHNNVQGPTKGGAYDENDIPVVIPDIVTMGKPFGNGMPLAAVVTTEAVSKAFDGMGVEYFNTFGGNPVSAAAGLAVLDVIEAESLQQRAQLVGTYLMERLRSLQQKHAIIGDIRGSGLFIGVEFVRDRSTKIPATAETSFICTILKGKYYVLTSIDGPHNNVIVIKPPMVFDEEDVDEFITKLDLVISIDMVSQNFDRDSMTLTPT